MQAPSPAKQRVIDFVTKTDMEECYTFVYDGNKEAAEKFVHRMRVELSRLRKMLKSRGRKTALFKVLIVKMDEHEMPGGEKIRTTVVLKKSGTAVVQIDENLKDALDAIERGAR